MKSEEYELVLNNYDKLSVEYEKLFLNYVNYNNKQEESDSLPLAKYMTASLQPIAKNMGYNDPLSDGLFFCIAIGLLFSTLTKSTRKLSKEEVICISLFFDNCNESSEFNQEELLKLLYSLNLKEMKNVYWEDEIEKLVTNSVFKRIKYNEDVYIKFTEVLYSLKQRKAYK